MLLANISQFDEDPRDSRNLQEHKETAFCAPSWSGCATTLLALDWDAPEEAQSPDVDALKLLCTVRFSTDSATSWSCTTRSTSRSKQESKWRLLPYHTVDTPEQLNSYIDELKRQPRFCIDTETTAIDPLRADLVGLSFCWKSGRPIALAAAGPAGSKLLDEVTTLEALRRAIFGDPEIEKVGQNIKYAVFLAKLGAGVELHGPLTDTMVLSYLLESGERNHNLDQLSQRLLDHTMIPITDLIGKGKNQLRMDQVAVDRIAEYAGEDAERDLQRIETILSGQGVGSRSFGLCMRSWSAP